MVAGRSEIRLAGALALVFFAAGCAAAAGARGSVPDERFRLATSDGRNVLEHGALVQVLARASDDARDPQADFELKRVRPELSGRLAGGLAFNIEPNFGADEVELEEAWIGPELALGSLGEATLHLGRMKAPFNLEEVRSRRHIDFPFFSIVNQLAPAEDHGAFLLGQNERLEYGAALYNGTGGDDTNGSKDVALRLMVHPFERDTGAWHEHLQLGIAGTFGVQDEDLAGEAIENETKLPIVPFTADARLSGSRERLGLEAAWFHGPWFLQSEYLGVQQEMSSTTAREDVRFHGGYVTLARVLTGESKSFAGVVPAEPFDFASRSGRGAWVAALRYSILNLDDDLAATLVVPGSFTDQVQTASVALNWIPNAHAILRTALVASFYEGDIQLDTGSGDREGAVLVEFQLHD
jgi:phosphate-selective porin OprO/OprP